MAVPPVHSIGMIEVLAGKAGTVGVLQVADSRKHDIGEALG